ncbi:MAG: MATE family efflux transporter [Clostridia bacterium]|nr:MATE family efflux transporter [Clostridia bacterium]
MSVRKKKSYNIDMCNGSVSKKMLIFAVPLMFSGILQLLFNAADIIVVGNFAGDKSLAAVGATSSVINLLTNLFIGLSVGANVLVANYIGANEEDDLKKTVHTAMATSVISGVILTVTGIVFAPFILTLMQTPEEVKELSTVYLRSYFLGMTAVMVYNFGAGILRAIGDTRRPLIYLSVAGVVNVVLNLIFVVVFRLDVLGVGLATAISQVVSALLTVRCLMRENSGIRLILKELTVDRAKLLRMIQIGLPAGFQGMLFSLANTFIQSSVNSFGTTVIAGNSASANIEGFAFTAMNSFHQASLSFTGQNVGARREERLNKILFTAIGYVLAVGLFFALIYNLFGTTLLGLYTKSPEVIEAGMKRLVIIATSYALCGMMDVVVGSLRGMGYSLVPMSVSVLGICALRLVWLATVFKIPEYHTPEMIYYTYPLSWIVTLVAHLISFAVVRTRIHKKWKNTL